MLLKTDRLTIRHIVVDDWKSIKAIWVDFRADDISQYDKPHNTEDEDVRARIAKSDTLPFISGRTDMSLAIVSSLHIMEKVMQRRV